jgi:chromosome partitioning protein
MESLQERFGQNMLPPIHRATILRECAANGQTIFEADPDSRAATEYQVLTRLAMKF